MARGDSYQLQGQQGGVVLGAGANTSANIRWIQVINDTVLGGLTTSSNLDNSSTLIGPTLPAGIGIGGKFTNVEVSTGLVIAYYE